VPLLRQLGDYYREASGANGPMREAVRSLIVNARDYCLLKVVSRRDAIDDRDREESAAA